MLYSYLFFQAEDGIRDYKVTGVQTCALPILLPLWHSAIADQIELVSTEQANSMAVRLAQEEGLFGGTSTGANVVAALRLAEELGGNATIVTVMCDTGMKYLSRHASKAKANGNS